MIENTENMPVSTYLLKQWPADSNHLLEISVAPHWNSPSLYNAACHGQAPWVALPPPTILERRSPKYL